MGLSRTVRLLFACGAALVLLAAAAEARGSRRRSTNNRNNNRGGRYRLIDGEEDSQRKREEERRKKQEEEKKKKEEARRKQIEERKKAQEEKKKAAEEKKKAAAEQAKAKREARTAAKATGGKATAAKKSDDKSDEEAAKLYEEAEAAFEKGDLMPGVALLRQCIAEGDGTDAAKDAEARLDQLLGMQPYGPMIYLGEAEELFAGQRYRRAFNKFNELVTRYPDSEQAAEAQKRLAEIREGDLLSKTVYTDEELKDARFWLLVGNIHGENDRSGEAKAAWRKVVEDFPGCPYAKQAEEKLAAVRGS